MNWPGFNSFEGRSNGNPATTPPMIASIFVAMVASFIALYLTGSLMDGGGHGSRLYTNLIGPEFFPGA